MIESSASGKKCVGVSGAQREMHVVPVLTINYLQFGEKNLATICSHTLHCSTAILSVVIIHS